LGIVAQDLREFEQARKDYQQALQIDIEFGDRYSESIVYSQLGSLAESMDEISEAIAYHLKALEIRVALNDKYRLNLTLENLDRLYKSHPSPQFLSQITQALGSSEAEVLQLFEAMG
jgi:tetratricopeptide (TPR) repeat protein